ncbi:MAG: phosphotransferase family protein, partial [Roseinatronobacter sp.]|nr:phosphotransferase family protein [Roseinatronobacter sp.]
MTSLTAPAELDLAALAQWLGARLPGAGLPVLQRIGGGQSNPTWFVEWGGERLVLRKKPQGPTLPGAHAIEREFRVMNALQGSDVPVPKVLWLEEDATILGAPFYVMERLEGRVFETASLPGVAPQARHEMYLDMARTLARLHALRPDDIGLSDYGRPGNYFARQISRWSAQYHASDGPRIAHLDRLVEWLPRNMPEDDGAIAIAHGDFRVGNMMFHPTEPRVIGVLDWELSTLGHPLADLGFCVIPWHSAPDEYGGLLGTDWRAAGIPERAMFEAEYHAHARLTAPLKAFHVAFALFRFAVIFV